MVDYKEKIEELEKLISKTKYNKKTQGAIGLYKAQLARLRNKDESRRAKGTGGVGYNVRKTGDGTVIILGFPSAGKSTLLNSLTDAKSAVGDYAFTTLSVIPGVMKYKHAKIQILDVPGVVEGAATGRGRGKEVLACMHSADLCLILLDATKTKQLKILMKEIYDANVRLGQRKPDVKIRKIARGGIRIGRTVLTPDLTDETTKKILQEFKISNAEVLIRTPINSDQLIDIIDSNKVYMPYLVIINKIDLVEDKNSLHKLKSDAMISATIKQEVDKLRDLIYDKLELMPIFLKEPGKKADVEVPLIMFQGAKIRDICKKLHREFVDNFKFARIWRKSSKFAGRQVGLNHKLKDEDIIELHMK